MGSGAGGWRTWRAVDFLLLYRLAHAAPCVTCTAGCGVTCTAGCGAACAAPPLRAPPTLSGGGRAWRPCARPSQTSPPSRPCRWRLRLDVMRAAIADNPEYADHVAHKFNKWCAISMFVMYNSAAILIFSINTVVWG